MKTKKQFTSAEISSIEDLVRRKCNAPGNEQKAIRNRIREIGFYWTDFSQYAKDFGLSYDPEGFKALVRKLQNEGVITIKNSSADNTSANNIYAKIFSGRSLAPLKKPVSRNPVATGITDRKVSIDVRDFDGGVSVEQLWKTARKQIPDASGVYVVVRESKGKPEFLKVGTGGYFKGEDPNVPVSELRANWVDGASIVYIGKATSLKSRLSQYLRFGQGKPAGHRGGRYIWQLKDAPQLKFYWKEVEGDYDAEESAMINAFKARYGCRPFANLVK
jgi:hypothetical protein